MKEEIFDEFDNKTNKKIEKNKIAEINKNKKE